MIGFIGCGNMGSAILRGILKSGMAAPDEVRVFDKDIQKTEKLCCELAISFDNSCRALASESDYIILAVKPNVMDDVLKEIIPVCAGKRIISIAAGITMRHLNEAFGKELGVQLLRVMPNTPAMVGSGFTFLCSENSFDHDSFAYAVRIFSSVGETAVIPEKLFNAAIALTGSSPAYIYMMIEALADGAVLLGMDRKTALRGAAYAVMGSAKMSAETGRHPASLRDDVCSPGGTTIEAVYSLEKNGFEAVLIEAMKACAEKSAEMNQAADRGKEE